MKFSSNVKCTQYSEKNRQTMHSQLDYVQVLIKRAHNLYVTTVTTAALPPILRWNINIYTCFSFIWNNIQCRNTKTSLKSHEEPTEYFFFIMVYYY